MILPPFSFLIQRGGKERKEIKKKIYSHSQQGITCEKGGKREREEKEERKKKEGKKEERERKKRAKKKKERKKIIYTHNRRIKLINLPPFLLAVIHDINLIIFKRPFLPNSTQHLFGISAQGAI
jgi:hypothetical protein